MLERQRSPKSGLVYLIGFVFFGLPALIGYGAVPLTNFTAEALCPVGLALMLIIVGLQPARQSRFPIEPQLALAAFGLIALVTCAQFVMLQHRHLDAYLVILGYFCCAAIAVLLGYTAAGSRLAQHWFYAAAASIALAAAIATLASVAQYFEVDARSAMISPASDAGRTFGFFRQPNQQGTFLNMGLAALLYLHQKKRLSLGAWLALSLFVVFGIASTGSRTAMVQTAFISLCGLALSLPHRKERFKALLPLMALATVWLTLFLAGRFGGSEFYGAQKLNQVMSEGIGMRSAAWHQTLIMLWEQPWVGYGVLRYPSIFFLRGSGIDVGLNMSHSHNLILQLGFDFGLPVALLFCGLIAWSIWRMRGNWSTKSGFFCAMVLGCLLIHSLVEFPLWYTYFLLPGCWFLGWFICPKNRLQTVSTLEVERSPNPPRQPGQLTQRIFCFSVAALVLSTVLWMNRDYFHITPAFAPGLSNTEFQRVEDTKKAFWFSRFSEFAQLQVSPLSVQNAPLHMQRAAALGCIMSEVWFQTATLAVMAQTGHMDDAKWIVYIISKMTKSDMSYFRKGLADSNLPATEELIRFMDHPVPVQRSIKIFEQTCGFL